MSRGEVPILIANLKYCFSTNFSELYLSASFKVFDWKRRGDYDATNHLSCYQFVVVSSIHSVGHYKLTVK